MTVGEAVRALQAGEVEVDLGGPAPGHDVDRDPPHVAPVAEDGDRMVAGVLEHVQQGAPDRQRARVQRTVVEKGAVEDDVVPQLEHG
jgi:hypothetical protein